MLEWFEIMLRKVSSPKMPFWWNYNFGMYRLNVNVLCWYCWCIGQYSNEGSSEQTSRGIHVLCTKETRLWRRYIVNPTAFRMRM